MKSVCIFLMMMHGVAYAMENPSSSGSASQKASLQVSELNSEVDLPLVKIETLSLKKKTEKIGKFDKGCRTLMLLESKVVEGKSFTLTEPEVRQGVGNLDLSEREIADLKFYLKKSIPLTQVQLAVYRLPHEKFLAQFPIVELNLANNNLKDLPDEFFQLAGSLEVLHLDSNKFTMVPPILAWCNKLRVLSLTKNQIRGRLPEWMRKIKELAIDLDASDDSEFGSNFASENAIMIKSASSQSTNTQDLLTNSQGNASAGSSQPKSEQES